MLKSLPALGLLFAASIAQAQERGTLQPYRCDPFRTAVMLDLCKDSVTFAAQGMQTRTTFAYSDGSPFPPFARLVKTTSPAYSASLSWTPLDYLRIGISGTLSARSGMSDQTWIASLGLLKKDSNNAHVTPGLDVKLRLWKGDALGGEHRLFALGEAQLVPSYRFKQHGLFVFPPLFAIPFQRYGSRPETANATFGLQSAHRWGLTPEGLDLIAQNDVSFRWTEGGSPKDYTLETRIMLADMARGVALGPKVQFHDSSPRGTRIHGYLVTGVAGYIQPFRTLDVAALRGLVLDGSIGWLVRRHLDRPGLFGPGLFPPQPTHNRMHLSTRLRYTIEY